MQSSEENTVCEHEALAMEVYFQKEDSMDSVESVEFQGETSDDDVIDYLDIE